jgi:hypothetical protein
MEGEWGRSARARSASDLDVSTTAYDARKNPASRGYGGRRTPSRRSSTSTSDTDYYNDTALGNAAVVRGGALARPQPHMETRVTVEIEKTLSQKLAKALSVLGDIDPDAHVRMYAPQLHSKVDFKNSNGKLSDLLTLIITNPHFKCIAPLLLSEETIERAKNERWRVLDHQVVVYLQNAEDGEDFMACLERVEGERLSVLSPVSRTALPQLTGIAATSEGGYARTGGHYGTLARGKGEAGEANKPFALPPASSLSPRRGERKGGEYSDQAVLPDPIAVSLAAVGTVSPNGGTAGLPNDLAPSIAFGQEGGAEGSLRVTPVVAPHWSIAGGAVGPPHRASGEASSVVNERAQAGESFLRRNAPFDDDYYPRHERHLNDDEGWAPPLRGDGRASDYMFGYRRGHVRLLDENFLPNPRQSVAGGPAHFFEDERNRAGRREEENGRARQGRRDDADGRDGRRRPELQGASARLLQGAAADTYDEDERNRDCRRERQHGFARSIRHLGNLLHE